MTICIVDANVVVSAALRQESIPQQARVAAVALGPIALSRVIHAEIIAVLGRPKFARAIPDRRRADIMELLETASIWFGPVIRVEECRDAKDNAYLELALAASADVILTGDSDLLVLDPWRSVRILSPADFLAWTPASRVEARGGFHP